MSSSEKSGKRVRARSIAVLDGNTVEHLAVEIAYWLMASYVAGPMIGLGATWMLSARPPLLLAP